MEISRRLALLLFPIVIHVHLRQSSWNDAPRPFVIGAAPEMQGRASQKSRGYFVFFFLNEADTSIGAVCGQLWLEEKKENVVFFTDFPFSPLFVCFKVVPLLASLVLFFCLHAFSSRARRTTRGSLLVVVAVDVVAVVPLSLGPFDVAHFFFFFLFFFFLFLRRRGTRTP